MRQAGRASWSLGIMRHTCCALNSVPSRTIFLLLAASAAAAAFLRLLLLTLPPPSGLPTRPSFASASATRASTASVPPAAFSAFASGLGGPPLNAKVVVEPSPPPKLLAARALATLREDAFLLVRAAAGFADLFSLLVPSPLSSFLSPLLSCSSSSSSLSSNNASAAALAARVRSAMSASRADFKLRATFNCER